MTVPECFGHPCTDAPCNACALRMACMVHASNRGVFLLPNAHPVAGVKVRPGAQLAIEDECVHCGPTQAMLLRGGVRVCAQCKEGL